MARNPKSTALRLLSSGIVAAGVCVALESNRWQWAVGSLVVMVFLAAVDAATGRDATERPASRILMVVGFGLLSAALLLWLATGNWWYGLVGLGAFVLSVILDAATDRRRPASTPNAAQERYR